MPLTPDFSLREDLRINRLSSLYTTKPNTVRAYSTSDTISGLTVRPRALSNANGSPAERSLRTARISRFSRAIFALGNLDKTKCLHAIGSNTNFSNSAGRKYFKYFQQIFKCKFLLNREPQLKALSVIVNAEKTRARTY